MDPTTPTEAARPSGSTLYDLTVALEQDRRLDGAVDALDGLVGARLGRGVEEDRPSVELLGEHPGDLVGLVPGLGLVLPADGRCHHDAGERRQRLLAHLPHGATGGDQQHVAGLQPDLGQRLAEPGGERRSGERAVESASDEDPGEADDDYRSFIDQLVETAKGARFKPDIGRGEERLTGFHGG